MMVKNNINFDIGKKQLSLNDSNYIAKNILDIDFFNSRKSRILDNIKAEDGMQKLNANWIHEFKRAKSN